MYNYICDICGCYLDPGEQCDCQEERKQRRKAMDGLLAEEKSGQMVLKEAVDHGTHTWI